MKKRKLYQVFKIQRCYDFDQFIGKQNVIVNNKETCGKGRESSKLYNYRICGSNPVTLRQTVHTLLAECDWFTAQVEPVYAAPSYVHGKIEATSYLYNKFTRKLPKLWGQLLVDCVEGCERCKQLTVDIKLNLKSTQPVDSI